jgi:cytochrome d ubiquinol oxidase subunit I
MMSTEILSRLQFAFTIGFHILWPTLNIGLGLVLLAWEALWLKTQQDHWEQLYKFWVKIYALSFGLGVVSGVPLAYQFGTNFGQYSYYAGSVVGPLLGVEVMTAFFLEAVFVGMMLFGWGKVDKKVHFFATLFVVIGTFNSSIWILAANSWMHTPAGVTELEGQLIVTSWLEVIFNPSFKLRFAHMLLASYITCSLVIAGTHAYFRLNGQSSQAINQGLLFSLSCLVFLVPLQIFIGHQSGVNVDKYHPIKIAAMEGLWEGKEEAPLVLFAIPDQKAEKNHLEIAIPKLSSIIVKGDSQARVQGMKDYPREHWPWVLPIFFCFRIMVGCGFLFLLLSTVFVIQKFRGQYLSSRPFLYFILLSSPLGFIATVTGWMVAELGRQPWLVYKMFLTSQGVSKIEPHLVLTSLLTFIVVYTLLFAAFLYYTKRFVAKGLLSGNKSEPYLKVLTHTAHLHKE